MSWTHMVRTLHTFLVYCLQGIAWTSEFQLSDDSKAAEDDKDGNSVPLSLLNGPTLLDDLQIVPNCNQNEPG